MNPARSWEADGKSSHGGGESWEIQHFKHLAGPFGAGRVGDG